MQHGGKKDVTIPSITNTYSQTQTGGRARGGWLPQTRKGSMRTHTCYHQNAGRPVGCPSSGTITEMENEARKNKKLQKIHLYIYASRSEPTMARSRPLYRALPAMSLAALPPSTTPDDTDAYGKRCPRTQDRSKPGEGEGACQKPCRKVGRGVP